MKFKKDSLQKYKQSIKNADYVQQELHDYFSGLEDYIQCKMSVDVKVRFNHYQIHEMDVIIKCSNLTELVQTIDVYEIQSIRYVTTAFTNGYVQGGILLQLEFE